MASKKKPAVPPGDDTMIRILRPERRFGVRAARAASEIIHLHGAKTSLITESGTLFVELPRPDTLSKINAALHELGLQIVKSIKVAAAYEWQFHTVPRGTK